MISAADWSNPPADRNHSKSFGTKVYAAIAIVYPQKQHRSLKLRVFMTAYMGDWQQDEIVDLY
jgi:hypothetical protein